MKLTIDNTACNIASATRLDVGYNASDMSSPEKARTGRTVELLLPHTAANDRLFALHPNFNATPHTAQLTHQDAVLFEGATRLLATSERGYTIDIRDGAAEWAKSAALSPLKSLDLGFTGYLTPSDIAAGWSDNRAVKFLPVVRDSYEQQNSSTDLQPILRLLSPDDYHPFLHLDSCIRAIVAKGGYSIQSKFMEGAFFRSLYLSGAYASRDTVAVERRMGFKAVRLTTATATADPIGRVYASPHGTASYIGNIVETATPMSTDELGVARSEPYNNGNCFGIEGQKIVYRPTSEMTVAFEYHLRYTTDHRIFSRERLSGFDSMNLGVGGTFEFRLPNRYADRRSTLTTRSSYRIVVFDAQPTTQYRLSYTLNGVASVVWSEFTGRTTIVTTPDVGSFSSPTLYIRNGSSWAKCSSDWALYDGYIGEIGQTTVEITLRTPAQQVGPSSPKYFHTIFFAGAEAEMKLTLHTQCELRPLFSPAPAYGASITTADVAQHEIRQIELLEATQHLFNLRFYTDQSQKKLYIEPEGEFWASHRVADWRGLTDLSQSIVWEDAARQVHDSRTYGYLSGDGATTRLGVVEGAPFGSWSAHTDSYVSIEGDQKCTNPLFCPTLNAMGTLTAAPSASLMQVGDRDNAASDGVNFTPRIVRYLGLKPLPAGERWDSPIATTSYPLAAFHIANTPQQEGFTLCFGNRDAQQGLHRFYEHEEATYALSRHVTLTLRLAADQLESLFTLGSGVPDLQWSFRISTDQGDALATLRRIEHYDPTKESARCTFTLLPNQ